MKTIKVFYGDTRLKDIYPYATKWQVFKFKAMRFIRKVAIVTGIMFAVALCVFIGSKAFPSTVYVSKPITVQVVAPSPVLSRIADCESGVRNASGRSVTGSASQYDKNGQVVMRPNKNGSVDVGIMQINVATWGMKATALGYDLTSESDNKAMALWIYENRGTEDWYSSKSCWN